MSKQISSLTRRLHLVCLLLAACALAGTVRADDLPTFSDPDVTAYVKTYSEFTQQYVTIMKGYMDATKSGDTAKMQAAAQQAAGLQTKSAELQTLSANISAKLKPEEAQKFATFIQACSQKMADAMK